MAFEFTNIPSGRIGPRLRPRPGYLICRPCGSVERSDLPGLCTEARDRAGSVIERPPVAQVVDTCGRRRLHGRMVAYARNNGEGLAVKSRAGWDDYIVLKQSDILEVL